MEMKADKPCRVSRRKLRNLFGEGIEIQYGKEVVSISETSTARVKITFKDGSEAEGDVVVGCDGAHSITRSAICGKEDAALTKVPVSMFNFTAKFEAEQAKHIRSWNPLFLTSIHPDNGIMFWLSSTITSSLFLPYNRLMKMRSPRCTRPKRPLNMDLPSPNVLG
jgi:2-polyprenyl-6-methoxyphenol hydroxylase-like FAD-dependent oxidoreductase